jgi:hypothetical protein
MSLGPIWTAPTYVRRIGPRFKRSGYCHFHDRTSVFARAHAFGVHTSTVDRCFVIGPTPGTDCVMTRPPGRHTCATSTPTASNVARSPVTGTRLRTRHRRMAARTPTKRHRNLLEPRRDRGVPNLEYMVTSGKQQTIRTASENKSCVETHRRDLEVPAAVPRLRRSNGTAKNASPTSNRYRKLGCASDSHLRRGLARKTVQACTSTSSPIA